MAEARNDMKQRLDRNSENIIVHLLLMYFFPSNPARNHWRGEVFGWLPSITRFKGSHSYPGRVFIEQHLSLWVLDSVAVEQRFVRKVEEEGIVLPCDYRTFYPGALEVARRVLHDVSGVLEVYKSINLDDYLAILDDHGL
jgi:hypothetical protein